MPRNVENTQHGAANIALCVELVIIGAPEPAVIVGTVVDMVSCDEGEAPPRVWRNTARRSTSHVVLGNCQINY